MRVPHADRERALHQERGFDLRASIGLLLGGVPAVLIAALIVKELPLTVVKWVVVVVVLYTATTLLPRRPQGAQRRRGRPA